MSENLESQGISVYDVKWESFQESLVAKKIGIGLGKLALTGGLSSLIPGG